MKENLPIYLSNKPLGEDLFESGSHRNVADRIVKIISKNLSKTKVIGLEGEWGSGKSNIIEMVKNGLDKNFHTFIFDVWGTQEDLTRKAFLEELLIDLIQKNIITDSKKLFNLKKSLLSKKIETTTVKKPTIHRYWILILSSILLFGFFKSLHEIIFKEWDIPYFYQPYRFDLKALIIIFLVPTIFFLLGTFEFFKSFIRIKKKHKDLSNNEIINELLYWFSGKETSITENENIIENEPSLPEFRAFFSEIEKALKKQEKQMVIVFDNIDRIETGKLKSLWASINTFFAESNNEFNSWVIIPYNKKEIISLFGNFNDDFLRAESYLQKSIPIRFRVTPPIILDWEKYISEKFYVAFGEILDMKEINMVKKLYDIFTEDSIMNPRRFIDYINEIISLQLQNLENDIKLRYFALFVLTKNDILKNPSKSIINREYLKGAKNLFIDDKNLETCIASITYGVTKDKANEILISKEVSNSLNDGNFENLVKFKSFRSLNIYFRRAYSEIEISEKNYCQISKVLIEIYDVLPIEDNDFYWNLLLKEIAINKKYNLLHESFDIKSILCNSTNDNDKQSLLISYFNSLIRIIYDSLPGENISIYSYYNKIKDFEYFYTLNNLSFNFNECLKEVNFNYKEFRELIKGKKEPQKYKIGFFTEDLKNYYKQLDLIYEDLEYLEAYKAHYDFSSLAELTKARLNFSHNTEQETKKNLEIIRKIGKKPFEIVLDNQQFQFITGSLDYNNINFNDKASIAISNIRTYSDNKFFDYIANFPPNVITGICLKLENYMSLQDLLEFLVGRTSSKNYSGLVIVLRNLLEIDNKNSIIDTTWVLKNFDFIYPKLIDNLGARLLIRKLENFENDLEKFNISELSESFYEFVDDKENSISEKLIRNSISYFMGLNKSESYNLFMSKKRTSKLLLLLIKRGFIHNVSDNIKEAYFRVVRQGKVEDNELVDEVQKFI